MGDKGDQTDSTGGNQPVKPGRPDIGTLDEKPRAHNRLNLLNTLQRCNSISDTNKKRKYMDTAPEDPYRKKESPEAFILTEAMKSVLKLATDLDVIIKDIPNTHLKIKEIAKKLKKKRKRVR